MKLVFKIKGTVSDLFHNSPFLSILWRGIKGEGIKIMNYERGLLIMLLMLLGGCVKELIPENNGYQAKPVIWAILNLDSTITIITSGNRGIEDNDEVNIKTIDMFLYENGVNVDHLFLQTINNDSQSHRFKVKPQKFKTYTLKLLNTSLDITSSILMPNPISKPDKIILTQGANAQLTYTIADDITFNDAYQFKVEMYHQGLLIDTATDDTINKSYFFNTYIDKFDEPTLNYDFLELNLVSLNEYTYPVADNLFNGKKRAFLFTLQNPTNNIFYRFRIPVIKGLVSDKFICKKQYLLIKCRKISPEYYKFLVSENKNNAIFGTPYFNPTNVFCNISGGLGLMAGIAERTDTVWVRK